ncbi:MAG: CBS domain-containing protein [Bacillaceae bacterium]|nr:CBS domain-containing protein [Bacillaceae bacterium]
MKNSDRFLASFHRIEKYLERTRKNPHHMSFKSAVQHAQKYDAIVRKYQDDLFEFADLRNAIVHDSINPNYAIAEPHDSTVEHIERIERELTEPETVIPKFKRKVFTFSTNDRVKDILHFVQQNGFTKFPVYDHDTFVGLLTENGITHWLAKGAEENWNNLFNHPLQEILNYEQIKENYRFIPKHTTVYEAEDIFKNQIQNGKRLNALLITDDGKPSRNLLGIITHWDIIHIMGK